jgi:IS30 family transposase
LRERGWSILAAAGEVGVSRTTGNNWSRGYKTYRHGQVAGFVPALDRLAVRQVSARFLSQDERIEIADLRHAGLSIRQVADWLGRAPSTISRELRRNAAGSKGYRPFEAHRRATSRRARSHPRRMETSGELRQLVAELLAQRWSPQQISRHLRLRFPAQPRMRCVTRVSIRPSTSRDRSCCGCRRWLCTVAPRCAPDVTTGAHQHKDQRRPRFEQPMLTIRQRPFQPEDRSQTGHWEGDLIIGKDQGSAIGTLVERQTRLVRLLHLRQRDGDTLHDALTARMADLPAALLRSITWDQGTEMARHLTITRSLGAPVSFCDSHSPWQRGSNENTNGLLRDYFPKGTDLSTHSPLHLLAVENELNNRPRIVLNDRAPAELFSALLASRKPSGVATLT